MIRRSILALACLAAVIVGAEAAAQEATQARVFVTGDADLVAVRDQIRSRGATIHDFVPERAFVITIMSDQVADLDGIAGVARVRVAPVNTPRALDNQLGATGDIPPTPEDLEELRRTIPQIESMAPTPFAQDRSLLAGVPTRAPAADNSLSQYFPPIRSQGAQGSCVAWATCYYYNTFTQSRDEGFDVTGGINDPVAASIIGSPAFLYNLMNDGSDLGSITPDAMLRLTEVGCASWDLMPYDQSNYTRWPSQEAWVGSMRYRTSQAIAIWLNSAASLEPVKQHLANGNLAVTRMSLYTNFGNELADGVDNGVLFSRTGYNYWGSHAVTIVGYDDDRPYQDNGVTKRGAFLLANSWGPNWGWTNSSDGGSKGFFWIAYDYMLSGDIGTYVLFGNDRDDYRPRLYATAGLEHPERARLRLRGGLTLSGGGDWNSYYPINEAGGLIPINEGKPVAVDLTDGLAKLANTDSVSSFVELGVSSAATSAGELTTAVFYYDFDGDGIFSRRESRDPPLSVRPGQRGFARATLGDEAQSVMCQYVTGRADPLEVLSDVSEEFTVPFAALATTRDQSRTTKISGLATIIGLEGIGLDGSTLVAEVDTKLKDTDDGAFTCASSARVQGVGELLPDEDTNWLIRSNSRLDGRARSGTLSDCGTVLKDGGTCSIHRVKASLRITAQGDRNNGSLRYDRFTWNQKDIFEAVEGRPPAKGENVILVCGCVPK